jgi:hypothetical protein
LENRVQVVSLCLQEKISEELRATLNAFLYRTGEQSNKSVLYNYFFYLDISDFFPKTSDAPCPSDITAL